MAQAEQNENIMNILMLEQEGKKLEEQLNALNQQAVEFINLQENLSSLDKNNEREILTHFGKG
ncbi:hypothetical protein HZB88_01380, partial [archaeon]|nr:hypothetical protein [archaeon]